LVVGMAATLVVSGGGKWTLDRWLAKKIMKGYQSK